METAPGNRKDHYILNKIQKANKMPALSLNERDRRWNAIRGMMREEDIDCLIIQSGGVPLWWWPGFHIP
jgi:hypothetical protein